MIATLHQEYSGRWSYMSKKMEGRTDNQIKNRYNSNLKKRINTREFKRLLEKFQKQMIKSQMKMQSQGEVDLDASRNPVTFDCNFGYNLGNSKIIKTYILV